MTKPIALQLWSVQDETEKDFFGTLEKVAEMGYDGVEFAGYYGKTADEIQVKLAELGLKAAGSHIQYEQFLTNLDEVLAFEKVLGNKNLIVPWAAFDTVEEWQLFADNMKTIAEKVTAAGFNFSYHNHNHEFEELNGQPILTWLLQEVPTLNVELDTYWVQFAGVDAVEYMANYAGRMKLVHLKDQKENPIESTEIGNGVLDIASYVKQAEENGVDWFVIEQEAFTQPTLKSVEIGLINLKRIIAEG
ncbi:MAG: sugar phosphate isomerase/epimerase [Carnobacterium sp.]|uniref:sugar phosphate isomerase/epimerase family protein n=1 Tax=Carnobacterium TaxID=2747 RepID=UPI001072DFDA|nr:MULTISPECIES: sugar phosphate isomerase/epimerase [Carnobacterium]MBC9788615.1 TIM barrel protein [Carnobacterium maltaromaticum]MBQ6485854.1 sugar phosphate isomerase/epimerase [Carnobacterium sp.]MDW5523531.1 sugar phosphate isomerase/epimerase [Carnobacterium maltaromaticum]TFJ76379.1 sugar phosphate isomerase [Carnobacterium maltaromaticum]TFJ79179.1 sugar phosphate isomerase [Carnobacterium maltaromaticum]